MNGKQLKNIIFSEYFTSINKSINYRFHNRKNRLQQVTKNKNIHTYALENI